MEIEKTVETNKSISSITIVNKNTLSWWDDINLKADETSYRISGCSLDIMKNYELTQMIQAYHCYVAYYNMMVSTSNNKLLSLSYLRIMDFENILLDIEKIELDLNAFKEKVIMLENTIKEKLLSYISLNVIELEEKSFSISLVSALKNIFKTKHKSSDTVALGMTVQNTMVKY